MARTVCGRPPIKAHTRVCKDAQGADWRDLGQADEGFPAAIVAQGDKLTSTILKTEGQIVHKMFARNFTYGLSCQP